MTNFGKKLFLSVLTLTTFFGFSGQVWAVTFNSTEIISKNTNGTLGDGASGDNYIDTSSDGRYVTFSSTATNLVSGDTNGVEDIFIRDTQLNTTTRVSVSTLGVEGNGSSVSPSISTDGRYVSFSSTATNLVSGDTNGVEDIFIRDTQLNTTTRVSVSTLGVESNGSSTFPSISTDGRYITFSSDATNLVTGDTNGVTDIFVRDTQLNTTTRVSVSTLGVEGNGQSSNPSMSFNGSYVVFSSDATNLVAGDTNGVTDIFIRDTQLNTTTRVSVSTLGLEADYQTLEPVISFDGRYILFTTLATNLVSGDTNNSYDIFIRDTQLNTTTRVSVSTLGVEGNDNSTTVFSISSDNRYIVFSSDATNLVAGDTNGVTDIFIRDTQLNTTTRVSVSTLGVEGDGSSYWSDISLDGEHLIIISESTNLVAGDTNGFIDVFLYTAISTPTTTTTSASSITTTTAVLTGNITDTGGEANTERGFDIGTDNTYTMSDIEDATGSYSTGSYSLTATGLTCGTTYYYRAYSTNTTGTGTGSDSTFTTSACPSSSGSSGSSASSRASNLINMGKIKEAQEIINQFPNVVHEISNTNNNTLNIELTNKKATERKGNRSNNVKEIQTKLKVKADGIFGPITEKAVKDFQKQNTLKVDGIVGPLTWKVINGF